MSKPRSSKRRPRPAGKDYEVGYKRPPVATQFKPGGIGNPKALRKKKKTIGEEAEEVVLKRVKLEEDGRSITVTVVGLIFRSLSRAAVRGNVRAAQLLFVLIDRYCGSPETTLNLDELESEDRKIIEEYLAMQKKHGTDVISEPTDKADKDSEESKPTDDKPTDKSEDPDGGST